MNTRAEILAPVLTGISGAERFIAARPASESQTAPFADEQISSLVRRLFVPGWPRPARQVVFSPIDRSHDINDICQQVAERLCSGIAGHVCIVNADLRLLQKRTNGGTAEIQNIFLKSPGNLRKSSRQLSERLWSMSAEVFAGGQEAAAAPAWLRERLAHLRIEFEFVLLQAPPAEESSDVALLGAMSEGVVLIVRANRTRRRTAQYVRQVLQTANARLLGTVLTDRVFPIPEGIYRRL